MEVPDWCDAVRRQLRRKQIDGFFRQLASRALSFWVRACVLSSQFWFLSHSLTYIRLVGFAKVWSYGQFWPQQGAPPCWVRTCTLESKFWALSHSLTYIKLIGFAKVWNYGQFWSPQGLLAAGFGHVRKNQSFGFRVIF